MLPTLRHVLAPRWNPLQLGADLLAPGQRVRLRQRDHERLVVQRRDRQPGPLDVVGEPELDPGHCLGDLPGDELWPAAR